MNDWFHRVHVQCTLYIEQNKWSREYLTTSWFIISFLDEKVFTLALLINHIDISMYLYPQIWKIAKAVLYNMTDWLHRVHVQCTLNRTNDLTSVELLPDSFLPFLVSLWITISSFHCHLVHHSKNYIRFSNWSFIVWCLSGFPRHAPINLTVFYF